MPASAAVRTERPAPSTVVPEAAAERRAGADTRRAARRIWGALAVLLVGGAASLAAAGIGVGMRGLLVEAGAVALLGTIAAIYHLSGRSESIARGAESSAQLIAIGALMEIVSYAVTRGAGPLRDAQLAHADRLLGFDWTAWTAAVHAQPRVAWALGAAYASMVPQLGGYTLYLALRRHANALLGMMIVSGVITIALSGLVPGVGHLLDAPHVPEFLALRADTLRRIDLAHLQGLISFPSYHAALAVIMTLAMWPQRYLRWPVALLNAMMLVATISEGGHYLVDVLAGMAIARVSLPVTRRWLGTT